MIQYDKISLGRTAKELGFVRDTFEKVCRLYDILQFIENDSFLRDKIALKGGTAINLTMMDLPRLSVDIDLDYVGSLKREQMLDDKEEIKSHLEKYMRANGYRINLKSKSYHALESRVYDYENAGGMKDNLKIEINYMLRTHILDLQKRDVNIPWIAEKSSILCVNPIEIFSTKVVALLTRSAARDLYDVHNMVRFQLFNKSDLERMKNCVAFYSAVGAEHAPSGYDLSNIDRITTQKIKTDLYPVLRHGDKFELRKVQDEIKEYLSHNFIADERQILFWGNFNQKIYTPELLFTGEELERVKNHPMAVWKCMPKEKPEKKISDMER